MDACDFVTSVKAKDSATILKIRSFKCITKAFRIVEFCFILLFLCWIFTRLPFAVRISGEYFRQLIGVILSPVFVFILCNFIVLTLLWKYHRHHNVAGAEVVYSTFLENAEFSGDFNSALETEYEDKQMIFEEPEIVTNKGLMKVRVVPRRTQSEKMNKENAEEIAVKLRRSETEKCRRITNSDDVLPEMEKFREITNSGDVLTEMEQYRQITYSGDVLTETEKCRKITYSGDTETEICWKVTNSGNIWPKKCRKVTNSGDTELEKCCKVTNSGDIWPEKCRKVTNSGDTSADKCGKVTNHGDISVEKCCKVTNSGNTSPEKCWKVTDSGAISPEKYLKATNSGDFSTSPANEVDELSNEEFQKAIENFIAKQTKFHRQEKLAIVLHSKA